MTAAEGQALIALLSSKKYADLCPDTVRRAFERALPRYRSIKEADKAARSALHQIAGAFLSEDQLRNARACLGDYRDGQPDALNRALSLHASTRERSDAQALYARVFGTIGRPQTVLDLACGLNPLVLGSMGVNTIGWDIHGGAMALINDWARACDWPVSAQTRDLLVEESFPDCSLALMMKLLPVLERQESGSAQRLIGRVNAPWMLVTFPTRTLSGRGVGMQTHYAQRFEALDIRPTIQERFVFGTELCYLLEGKNG